MKIGRNDPCPCGSGKKYKKCCLEKDEEKEQEISYNKNYFNLKGKNAEILVQELAEKSFFIDWCYKNPEWDDGKELCDLLVVFGDIAIIWQIKDLKRQKNGMYSQGKVEKNLSQLSGAKRKLFDLKKPIELINPRRGKELFSPDKIKKVYLISALVGEGEDYYSLLEKFKGKEIHVLNRETVEILLNELDTIKDFTDYLNKRESLLFPIDEKKEKKIILSGGEKDILAYYLMNERNFKQFKKANMVWIQEGCWDVLQSKPEYIRKKEEDKISYFWDFLINKAYLSTDPQYEIVAREMAKLNRFDRRVKSKAFFEGQAKASLEKVNNSYRRTIPEEGITYCFLYAKTRKRKIRKNMLAAVCFVTRGYFKDNQKVLGIATEMDILPRHSFEFCLLDFPEWTEVEGKRADEIKNALGIFKNQKTSLFHEDEYPLDFKTQELKNNKNLNKS